MTIKKKIILANVFSLFTHKVEMRVFGIKYFNRNIMKREQTVAYKPGVSKQEQTPMIRITNRFLIAAGFTVGSKFDVKYAVDVITITRQKAALAQQN